MSEPTTRFLREAGIRPGMRVLDAGCGGGAVTMLAAELVGPTGEVVGVDRAAARVAVARKAAAERALDHVSFVHGGFDAASGLFDAAIARRVLVYQADPVQAVRQLAAQVRPGGVLLFEEKGSTGLPIALAEHRLHGQVHRWIWTAMELLGAETQMGLKLWPVFHAAGLSDICVRCEAVVETPEHGRLTAPILRHLLPKLIEAGVATAQEVDLETLDARLAAERRAIGGSWIGDLVYCAWGKVPVS